MVDKELIDRIIDNDYLGLIDKVILPKKNKIYEGEDIAVIKEREVRDWIAAHGREPSDDSNDISEKILAKRYNVMKKEVKMTTEDILNSELFDEMLNKMDRNDSVLDFEGSVLKKHADKPRTVNDYVAKRTAVENFDMYEPMFIKVQREIDAKVRKIVPFSATGLEVGNFYIAGGLLCFLDDVYEKERTSFGRVDKRIHLIFANGTESNMLFATFQKIMSAENGRTVTVPENVDYNLDLNQKDVQTGIIYILRSSSDDETVTQFGKDLYKVGYTSGTVENRIKNAENEPTYLCAPVVIMEQWKCQNINAKALETFLHHFFAAEQKKIQVYHKGKTQIATEWFHVKLEVLEKTVSLIISGDIQNYRYDVNLRDIVRYK